MARIATQWRFAPSVTVDRETPRVRRMEQLEALLCELEEPARMLLRAALIELRKGRLDSAARVCSDQIAKRPALTIHPALLLALESTELRLAGCVSFSLPSPNTPLGQKEIFVARRPTFFDLAGWEHGDELGFGLRVIPRRRDDPLKLIAWPSNEGSFASQLVHEAIACLLGELAAFLGSPTHLTMLDEPP